MGKEWIKDMPELLEKNRDFYYFAFNDPFFVLDKTEDETDEDEVGLTVKQKECLAIAMIDTIKNTDGNILVIVESKRTQSIFQGLVEKVGVRTCSSRIQITRSSDKSINRIADEGQVFELVVIDKVEKFVSPDSSAVKALKRIKAKKVICTVERMRLKTMDFEYNRDSIAFRDADTREMDSTNSFEIASHMIVSNMPEQNEVRLFRLMTNQIKKMVNVYRFSLDVENLEEALKIYRPEEFEKKNEFPDKQALIAEIYKEMKEHLVGRYVYSFGRGLYGRPKPSRSMDWRMEEKRIERELEKLNCAYKCIVRTETKNETNDTKMINPEDFIRRYREYLSEAE